MQLNGGTHALTTIDRSQPFARALHALPTPIGDGFTKLPTSVQFDPVMLPPPGSSLRCTLGLPPQHLREVHWPALLEECVARIQAAVAQPTRVQRAGAVRRIGVLGALVYERTAEGQYRLYEWLPGEVVTDEAGNRHVGMPGLHLVPADQVVADGSPYKALWLTPYAAGLRQMLQLQWPGHPLINAYVDWARLRLEQLLWTEDIQRRVRAKVASALGFDPRIMQRARHWLAHHDGTPIRLADYNRVLWRRQQWPRLKAESPQWLPLLAQLWRRLPTEGDPVENLRALLLANGVSPAMWRLLHREGTGWTRELRHYYTKGSQRNGRAAIEFVLTAQIFGTRTLVPVWMLREMLNLDGNPNRPKNSYLRQRPDPVDVAMAARLGHWATEMTLGGDCEGLERLQSQCHLMLSWALHHKSYATSRAMRQISMWGLADKAEAWEQLRITRANTENAWRPRFDLRSVSHDGLEAVLLCSAAEILEEAQAMRHCADVYVASCRNGGYFMLSVRRKGSGARVATVGVNRGQDGLELHQMAGFANALVRPDIERLARRAVECMRRQASGEAVSQRFQQEHEPD